MHIIYVTRTHTQAVATAPNVSFLPSSSIIENLKEEAKYLGAAKIRIIIPFWENQKPENGTIRNQKPEATQPYRSSSMVEDVEEEEDAVEVAVRESCRPSAGSPAAGVANSTHAPSL